MGDAMRWIACMLLAAAGYSQEPVVERAALHVEVVKRGDITASVRGTGKLVAKKIAELTVPEFLAEYVQPGQTVFLEKLPTLFYGKVRTAGESIVVDLAGDAPDWITPGTQLDATIQTGRLKDVVYVLRPVSCKPDSEGTLYRLEPKGEFATRVTVRYGKYGHLPARSWRSARACGRATV